MKTDDSGQWILLSAVIVACSLGVLIFFLNTAMMTGHTSLNSVTAVPKDNIRDLRYKAISQVSIIGKDVNLYNTTESDRMSAFNSSYGRFVDETSDMYMNHGIVTNILYVPNYYNDGSIERIENVSLQIIYNDGSTMYQESVNVAVGG